MIGFFLIKDPYRSSIQIDLRIQSWSDHGLLTGTSTPLVFRLDVRGMNQWTSCRSPKNLINLTAWNYNEIGGARFIPGVPGVTDSKILGISDGASSSDPPILQGIGTVHYERLRNWRRDWHLKIFEVLCCKWVVGCCGSALTYKTVQTSSI